MKIIYRPYGENQRGIFFMCSTACIDYLQNQIAEYAIPLDTQLVEWIKGTTAGSVIPEQFDERVRFMAAELSGVGTACCTRCSICNREIPASELARQEWDNSEIVQGIRIGTSGFDINCPQRHCLLAVCTRVY